MTSKSPPPQQFGTPSRWEEVPILKKTIDLYKTYYTFLELFPKKDKHALGRTCEQYLIEIITLLLEASYLPKESKRSVLMKANTRFEMLKVLIRILHELKILDQKKYVVLQTAIQEIGKMFGGWLKTLP